MSLTQTSQKPFQPVEAINGRLESGLLLLCDHASNSLPEDYGYLGLDPAQFQRHIAYDIGAAAVTRELARLFEAPALLTCFSRLLIDPNRGSDDPTLVMQLSDGAIIPGNARIEPSEITRRTDLYWRPYREATKELIDRMIAQGPIPAIIGIHSFTPVWKERPRPWEIGILWDSDPRLAKPCLELLRQSTDLTVGDNEPYDGALEGDTMHEHGTKRGLAHMLIELRQDLIDTPQKAKDWAARLAPTLRQVLSLEQTHAIEFYPSRAQGRARFAKGPLA